MKLWFSILLCIPMLMLLSGCNGDSFSVQMGSQASGHKNFLYSQSYDSNTVSAYTVNDDGSLVAVAGSPFGWAATGSANSWGMAVDPNGKFVVVPSYGVTTKLTVMRIDSATGALSEVAGSPFNVGGSSLYDVVFHPSGNFLFLPNGAEVRGYSIDANGALTQVPGVPPAFVAATFAVTMDPDGKFLFASTRSVIHVFSVNQTTGELTATPGSPFVTTITVPERMRVSPSGDFLYVVNSDITGEIEVRPINPTTGDLGAQVAGSPFATSGNHWSWGLDFTSTGSHLYVANQNSIYGYSVNTTSGVLTKLASAPYPVGSELGEVIFHPENNGIVYAANGIWGGPSSIYAFSRNLTTGELTPLAGSPFLTGVGVYYIRIARVPQI